jgi:hypothetical protein
MAGPFEKIRPDQECLGDPLRFRLLRVRDPHPDALPVPQKIAEARNIMRGGNDENILNPRKHEGGQRMIDHRLVVNRQQLFADNSRERIEAGTGSPRENNSLVHTPQSAGEPTRGTQIFKCTQKSAAAPLRAHP